MILPSNIDRHFWKWSEQAIFDFLLIESKSIGWKIKRNKDKNFKALLQVLKLSDEAKRLRRNASKREREKFKKIKEEFKKKGWNILSSFINGILSKEDTEKRLRKLFREYYKLAFELGHKSSGIADWIPLEKDDYQWLESALKEEFAYLKNFLNDIENGYRKMPYEKRWQMYVDTLDHIFFTGKIIVVPEYFVIDWVVNRNAERCEGCLFLKRNSPYTVFTLPTVPKAGATPCLSNCKCKLRVRMPKSDLELRSAQNKSKRSILLALKKMKEK